MSGKMYIAKNLGFHMLEYIESSGTQYIDTGFIPKYNTRVVMDISNLADQANILFGTRTATSATDAKSYTLVRVNSETFRKDYYGYSNSATLANTSGRTIVDHNANTVSMYGVSLSNTAVSSGESAYALYLFACNTAGNATVLASFRLYSCRIYDNGTLVRDYAPCMAPDGSIGLYDKVNDLFYGNAGSGVFTGGEVVQRVLMKTAQKMYVVDADGLTAKVQKAYVVKSEEYRVLNYIESSGTQYINTGFAPNQNTRIVMDAQVTTQPSTTAWLFGARGSGYNLTKNLFLLNGTTWNADYYDYNDRATFSGINALDRLAVDYNKNTLTINNTSHTWTATTFQCPHKLVLFANNDNGTISKYINARLYSCQVYNNGTLIRDYVPCIAPDGNIGLYDRVGDLFYGNAGSGVFTGGAETGESISANKTKLVYQAMQPGSISVNRTSITMLGNVGMTQTATISYTGDGAITVKSSNTGVVTASISGNTVTVKSVATGNATVTITMADGTNYTGASCTISVSNTIVGTLNNTSWDTIKTIAAAGTGENYWSVGDCKEVTINGTVGDYTFSNETYYAYIIGINHNQSIEGNGIHFMMGKTAVTNGIDIAFCDSGYLNNAGTGFKIYQTTTNNSNEGGWAGSDMKKTICPAFLNALPSALQSVISACIKYSDNTGGGSDIASYVTSSSSKIWLLSEFEVQGTRSYANSAEQNYQKQYAYYANGNSKTKYKNNDTSTACFWWLRSTYTKRTLHFCCVNPSGIAAYYYINYAIGFAPCFKVA